MIERLGKGESYPKNVELYDMELEILHQDEHLVAINKPNNLLVHRTRLAWQDKRFALQILRNQIGQHVHPVHRLDRATSGILLFGLEKDATSILFEKFREKEVEKTYLAIVRGFAPESGVITNALKRMEGEEDGEIQEAETHFRCLDQIEIEEYVDRFPTSRYSLVEVNPKTGRRHQIRRHLARANHPIIGDHKHGDYRHNQLFRDKFELPNLMLHAYKTVFEHPITREKIVLKAKVPDNFKGICEKFGWELPA